MRISITIIRSNIHLQTDFLSLDVIPDMTFNDVKALVEGDMNVAPNAQHLWYREQMIIDNSQTLEQVNVQEGDMLGLSIEDPAEIERRRRLPQGQGSSSGRDSQRQRVGGDPETTRLQLLGNARLLEQVRRNQPELAAVVQDRDRFHRLWDEYQRGLAQADAEKEAYIAMLNADPMNVEVQIKMEEHIRLQRVQENYQKALEENPESFGRVNMLYIDVLVNNHPIKAFVDSGAQTTVMSPSAAEACGIMRLIDRRFGGVAVGVGTAEILGRVHYADIQMGPYMIASSFTVMDGKDVDFLLGLDMLKKNQMTIDLKENVLLVKDAKIPFLPESEIPKSLENRLANEPKIQGPDGTKVGARTGTVEQHGSVPAPAKGSAQAGPSGTRNAIDSTPSTASASAPRPNPAPAQAHEPSSSSNEPQPASIASSNLSPASITKMTNMGFSRQEVISALESAGGDEEVAISLLL